MMRVREIDWRPLRGPYGVILADPPWRYRTWNDNNDTKSARKHYRLMTLDQVQRLPVFELAAADCALVLWATQAQLHDAIDVVRAWGFQFKTSGAWAKQSRNSNGERWAFGTGFILRSAAEFFIVATRGSPKVSSRSERNLIVAPAREHSRKPDAMYEMIERLWPRARKCELFARIPPGDKPRPGWDAWGDEAGI